MDQRNTTRSDIAVAERLLALIALPIGIVIEAYAISVLWGWFVVPLGAPAVGMAHAFGINALVTVFVYDQHAVRDKDGLQSLAHSLVSVPIILLLAYFAHLMME